MKASRLTVEEARDMIQNQKKFESFINENKKFIHSIIKNEYSKNSMNADDSEILDDLFQEAILSLWSKALLKYTGETKFSTFSFVVIKNDLQKYLQNKTKFENKTKAPIVSIETMKREFGSSQNPERMYEYREDYWKVDPRKRCFEDELISSIDDERKSKNFSKMDKKIIEMKKKKYSIKNMAKELGLNIHTFKAYYYGSFKKKVQE